MQDYYAVLGVVPSATQEEIRQAFIAKGRELHPDAIGKENSPEFQELNAAYTALKRADTRTTYDAQRNMLVTKCPDCNGAGTVPRFRAMAKVGVRNCNTCNGRGVL